MIVINEDLLKGKSKYFKSLLGRNVDELNQRIKYAKLKGKKHISFLRGTGYSGRLSDEQFDLLMRNIESKFVVTKEESFGGDGERFVFNIISWG